MGSPLVGKHCLPDTVFRGDGLLSKMKPTWDNQRLRLLMKNTKLLHGLCLDSGYILNSHWRKQWPILCLGHEPFGWLTWKLWMLPLVNTARHDSKLGMTHSPKLFIPVGTNALDNLNLDIWSHMAEFSWYHRLNSVHKVHADNPHTHKCACGHQHYSF